MSEDNVNYLAKFSADVLAICNRQRNAGKPERIRPNVEALFQRNMTVLLNEERKACARLCFEANFEADPTICQPSVMHPTMGIAAAAQRLACANAIQRRVEPDWETSKHVKHTTGHRVNKWTRWTE